MDETDRKIFEILCRNPFVKGAEVARVLGLPVTTAIRRLNRIRSLAEVRVEMPAPVEALVFIEGEVPEMGEEVFFLTGSNWDAVMRVKAGSMQELESQISKFAGKVKNLSVVLISRREGRCWKK